jgi:glycosyltransferase involved in cell wall biosynthesis
MSEVTVILTLFRRPHTLVQQLESIQNQSHKPKEIIVLRNYYPDVEIPSIPAHLLENVHLVNSSKNFGVWGRFALGLLANTKYVCFFDDDTIPGRKWLQNCLECMSQKEGLYGTIGLVFQNDFDYYSNVRFGWDNPNEETIEVDIVGHSWFLKREWLCDMWSIAPDYNEMLKCGEDIALSCFLQKRGIPTLVPPHPRADLEKFGSDPQKAWRYGTEAVAISVQNMNFTRVYSKFVKEYGFRPLCRR